jgi:BlaI family penicillinase repressor
MIFDAVHWAGEARKKMKITIDRNYYRGSITAVIDPKMSRTKIHRLGDLQLRIMQILWARAEATVSEVHEALSGERDLAYTTMATLLRKMEARGLVKHRLDGRSFVYRAVVAEDAVSRGMADHLVDRLFEGSLSEMVHHLLTTREVSREELSKLEKMIAEMKKAR